MIDINLEFAFNVIVLFIVVLFSLTLWMLNRRIGFEKLDFTELFDGINGTKKYVLDGLSHQS
jgi:hypothetical protein